MGDRSLHCVLDIYSSCDLDLEPMTFIYELDRYCLELHQMCKYELPDVNAFDSYRLRTIFARMEGLVNA